jgi:hypothetical protein
VTRPGTCHLIHHARTMRRAVVCARPERNERGVGDVPSYRAVHAPRPPLGRTDDIPEPAAPTAVIAFDPDRHRHVDQLTRAAATAGVTADRAAKLAAATDEIAAAAHRDSGHARIRLWHDHAAVLCEITDPRSSTTR